MAQDTHTRTTPALWCTLKTHTPVPSLYVVSTLLVSISTYYSPLYSTIQHYTIQHNTTLPNTPLSTLTPTHPSTPSYPIITPCLHKQTTRSIFPFPLPLSLSLSPRPPLPSHPIPQAKQRKKKIPSRHSAPLRASSSPYIIADPITSPYRPHQIIHTHTHTRTHCTPIHPSPYY